MVSFGFSHPGDQQQWMGYVAEILYLMCTYQKIIVPNLFIYQCQCVQTWGLGYGKWERGFQVQERDGHRWFLPD